MHGHFAHIELETRRGFETIDITPMLHEVLQQSGIAEGQVIITSLHTTVALTVNENEERLLHDIKHFFLSLASPQTHYLHNDIHLRDCPPDEPENAHAHLIAMMLGNAETLIVHEGQPVLGRWQSLLMVELDGPRRRKLAVQVLGT